MSAVVPARYVPNPPALAFLRWGESKSIRLGVGVVRAARRVPSPHHPEVAVARYVAVRSGVCC